MQIAALIVTIVLGLVFGSFLNVCIFRIPSGESIVFGRSHCMSCGKQISSVDLVPVFSYIFLRGRCRSCGAKISPRYPLVEALNAGLWAAALCVFGIGPKAVIYMIFFSCLIVVSFIDIDTSTIPFAVDVLILLTGIAACFFDTGSITVIDRLLGVAAGGLPLLAIMIGTRLWFSAKRKKLAAASNPSADEAAEEAVPEKAAAEGSAGEDETIESGEKSDSEDGAADDTEDDAEEDDEIPSSGMGGGDVELMAAAGLLLGWKLILFAMFCAFVIGAVFSVILIFTSKKNGRSAIQFGPFLALGMALAVFFGNSLIGLYMSAIVR